MTGDTTFVVLFVDGAGARAKHTLEGRSVVQLVDMALDLVF